MLLVVLSLILVALLRFNDAAIFATTWNLYIWMFVNSLVVVLTFQAPPPKATSNSLKHSSKQQLTVGQYE